MYSHLLSRCFSALLLAIASFSSLQADAELSGKVIDSATTLALEEVHILVLDKEEKSVIEETYTDEQGKYLFPSLSAGEYKVRAERDGYLSVSASPLPIKIDKHAVRANFSLGLPGGIAGSIVSSETKSAIADVTIDLMRGDRVVATTKTDASGNYRFDSLPPRPYIMKVKAENYQASLLLAIPVANQITSIDISLQRPYSRIAGKVENAITKEPLVNAIVSLITNGVTMDSVQTDEDGSYSFSLVPSNDYQILVLAARHLPDQQFINIASNDFSTVDFFLEPIGQIQGIVSDALTGRPIKNATIGVWRDGILFSSAQTDDGGYFAVDAARECAIIAQAQSYCDSEQTIEILAGSSSSLDFAMNRSAPTPPKRVVVVVSLKKQGKQTSRTHYVKWRESADPKVVAYRIYRDGKFLAEVSAKQSFVYKDKSCSGKEKKYEVTAVNDVGLESLPKRDEGIKPN